LTDYFPPGPREPYWGHFDFLKILGDILNFVFIAGVNDNGDKLFTSVNATGDKLLPVSLTRVIKPYSGFHKFYDTGD
jgi:hypothetical protein